MNNVIQMPKNDFKSDHEAGLEYQDFVTTRLAQKGIVLVNLVSKLYQETGENIFGMEIKLDRHLAARKRVFIETGYLQNYTWVPSGATKEDNSWLYAIGDYSVTYVFAKKLLAKVAGALERGKSFEGVSKLFEIGNGRARGFTIDEKKADIRSVITFRWGKHRD
jgi:hypothetical protein